jgi:leucyl-tRNA synthetase
MNTFFAETLYPFKAIENHYTIHETTSWDSLMEQVKHKPKFYLLAMFPYPSGHLHCGHVRNFLYVDLLARYYRYLGYAVLNPLGWDSFGLPAENAAKEAHINPKIWTENNIETMKKTIKDLGFAVDWSMELATHRPQYYSQQQKIFIAMFKKGLCYKKKGLVFWDPKDNTVLSKDQVIDGKGWRSGHPVEMKIMDQWYFKITQYVEPLIQGLDQLDQWPADIKLMQKKWMEPSHGFIVDFKIDGTDKILSTFTTKPNMLYGCTFLALSLSHPWSIELSEIHGAINDFIKNSLTTLEEKDYRGIFTGHYGIHPITQEKIPIYITTYVNNDFGTGSIYGVSDPYCNLNDYNFTREHNLPLKPVVDGPMDNGIIKSGTMVNSGPWSSMKDDEAIVWIQDHLQDYPFMKKHTTYNLHDWSFARQRYWGCPIPLINCKNCGVVPSATTVLLPEDVDFSLHGNPLDNHPTWKHVACPQCGQDAVRETSTMDTFVDSCWYFFRYFSMGDEPVDTALSNHVMPIDLYIGGREHAVGHLLYCRFFTKILKELGYTSVEEPVKKLVNQGFVCMASYYNLKTNKYVYPKDVVYENPLAGQENLPNYDRSVNKLLYTMDGDPVQKGAVQKMSKSKKNIIDPYEIKEIYGVDVLRFTMISDNPVDSAIEIRNESFVGASRFLNNVWMLGQSIYHGNGSQQVPSEEILSMNQWLEKSDKQLKNLEVNVWAVSLRSMAKILEKWVHNDYDKKIIVQYFNNFLKLLSIVCPYIANGLWELINQNNKINQGFIEIIKIDYNCSNINWKIMINNKFKCCLEMPVESSDDSIKEAVEDHLKITIHKMFMIKNRSTINIIQ